MFKKVDKVDLFEDILFFYRNIIGNLTFENFLFLFCTYLLVIRSSHDKVGMV